MKLLNLPYLQNKDFRKFIYQKRLSYSTFLFTLLGSWLICFSTAFYLGILDFRSWLSSGSFFILWLIGLAISFWLGQKPSYQKIIWYLNQLGLQGMVFLMIFNQPQSWFLIFFEYLLLFFLTLSWGGNYFLSPLDLLLPAGGALVGLLFFFEKHMSLFTSTSLSLLIFLLSLIFIIVIALTSVWNMLRVVESLENVYREKETLEETAQVLRIRIRAKTKELRQQAENLKKESALRTQALRERIQELERFREVTVGRELRMVELKKEMKQLRQELQKLKHERKN